MVNYMVNVIRLSSLPAGRELEGGAEPLTLISPFKGEGILGG